MSKTAAAEVALPQLAAGAAPPIPEVIVIALAGVASKLLAIEGGRTARLNALPGMLAAHGLAVFQTEDDVRVIDGAKGDKYLRASFAFLVVHERGDQWRGALRQTALVAFTGADAYALAMQAARDLLMEGLFPVRHGMPAAEGDAHGE